MKRLLITMLVMLMVVLFFCVCTTLVTASLWFTAVIVGYEITDLFISACMLFSVVLSLILAVVCVLAAAGSQKVFITNK